MDPLLNNRNYPTMPNLEEMQRNLDRMKQEQQRLSIQVDMPAQQQPIQQRSVWDDITEELNSLNDGQKEILFSDPEYRKNDMEIAQTAAKYQMSLLMPYVLSDKDGKKALETQLYMIRAKKEEIIKQEEQERKEFLKWKESRNSKTAEEK